MSKYNFSEHKDEIITHIIKNIIWFPIATLIPIVGTLFYTIITNKDTNIIIIITLIMSILISVSSTIFIFYNFNKIKKDVNRTIKDDNQITSISSATDFRIKKVECELYFENRTDIISSVEYEMIANNDNISYFEKEIMWTGKEYYGTEMTECNGKYKFDIVHSNDAMHKYKITFLEPIKHNDIVRFKIETKVKDTTLAMQPINSYMVKNQVDTLIIRVIAPPQCITNVKKAVYVDLYRQLPITEASRIAKKSIGGKNGKESYEATFTNPTISHRCFIEWEFTNI